MFKSKCLPGSAAAGAKSQANPSENPVDAITGLFKKKKP